MSGSSRRGFLRDLAAAAARARAQREAQLAEDLDLDLDDALAPDGPAAAPLDPPDADDGLGAFLDEDELPYLSDPEVARYERQLVLAEWSGDAQIALAQANVLVVGAGALGAPVALYLAGAGVGRLGILDDDAVELSNLHRQLVHFTPDIGTPKAESAAAKLRFLNPDIVVEPYQARFGELNGPALVAGQDLVVDCSDNFATRYVVNAVCCAAGVPLVEAGVAGFAGLVMPIVPGDTPCYRCLFPVPPDTGETCVDAGVLGPAAGVVGSIQALEALRLLAGLPGGVGPGFLQLDLLTHDYLRVKGRRRADCPDCGAL
jgi:molybdopterin/thiamine biosynthesis adenylyltransferase